VKNKRLVELVMLFVVAALVSAMATGSRAADMPAKTAATAAGAAALSSGEVSKVDKGAGKITIKHGPLANLDMPAMTMAFAVKDPAVLDRFKAGDRIAFVAEKGNGGFVVTRIEASK
jgi:Cu(I)/Ag(I) efflux system protein CusF